MYIRQNYNKTLQHEISNTTETESSTRLTWKKTKKIIHNTANSVLGKEKGNAKPNRSYDPVLAALSEEQKQVRIKINESKSDSKKKELKAERDKLLHELQSMVKCKRNNELDKAAEDIVKLPDHARMFKAVKSLNRKKSEKPKMFDADGKFITNIDEIQIVIGKHLKDKFRDEQIKDLEPFQGDARDLNNPITTTDVEKALDRLNNNRACGEDGIPGELIKYGADTLAKVIYNIFNRDFSEHDDININGAKVITLKKTRKG
ncbi:very-long-chain enoyl-CoA reductase [Elysia marginata]|uniref:Very-long-chain enoyl-CoA reductase n=1 Tax=Elysia marginata TaxID=1093978 RepID=A0AAV4JPJ9_9GAST|nr:very-long-chain enoyl-CoA reductase [Elysia marginata]